MSYQNKRIKKPLIMTYGAGHAQISAALGKAFIEQGIEPYIVGLTTARKFIAEQGLQVKSVLDLIKPEEDAPYIAAVEAYVSRDNHPNITAEETQAYLALGLHSLALEHGFEAALEIFAREGRKCFEPVQIMQRYLRDVEPDLVITTTSPRFELALLKAAKILKINSLSVSDFFLQSNEKSWILGGVYADHLTVIHQSLADTLRAEGLKNTKIHVTGNPAFDSLAPKPTDQARREELRTLHNLTGKTVVLWPAAASTHTYNGLRLTTLQEVSDALEPLCQDRGDLTYILRPHPNFPVELPPTAQHGILDHGLLSVDDAILVSDIVLTEVSTVGLQSCLKNKPVICVGFEDYTFYPKYGWANTVSDWKDAVAMIADGSYKLPQNIDGLNLGKAAQTVVELAVDIMEGHYD